MSEGKITSLKIDTEIVQISPFPFDKLTTLLDKAKEYYEGKAAFEKAKHNFEILKKDFEQFTEKPIQEPQNMIHPVQESSENKITYPSEPIKTLPEIKTTPERVIVAPSITPSETSPISSLEQPRDVQEDAEYIVSHVKILSVLKRSGKTASKDDIKSVISRYTTHDPDEVTDKVIEILKAKGKIA